MIKLHRNSDRRVAFTLIEMLVALTILLIVLSLTAAAISFTRSSDRVSGAAGQLQSFLAGARDRAIYNKEPRGVRFFIDPAAPGASTGVESRTVSTMAHIGPGGTWGAPENSSRIDLLRVDGNSDGDFDDDEDLVMKVRGTNNPGWWNLKRRGWLVDGLRIRIPAGPAGQWHTIDTSLIDTAVAPTDEQFLLLETPYAYRSGKAGEVASVAPLTYEIELPARILPLDPLLMPEGVAIDLDGSKVPADWRPGSTGSHYSGYMDVWFSPRGSLTGGAAASGLIHFYVCDSEDSLFLKEQFVEGIATAQSITTAAAVSYFDGLTSTVPFVPMDEIDPTSTFVNWMPGATQPYIVKDRRIVSLFSQTGAISVHKVNSYVSTTGVVANDANPTAADGLDAFDVDADSVFVESGGDGLTDDPYRFAELGEVAE